MNSGGSGTPPYAPPEAGEIRSFFDRIAPRYDLVNDLLSFGIHRLWRRTAVRESGPVLPGAKILDIGTGSGKLLESYLARHRHRFKKAVGIDFSAPLLERARRRLAASWEAELVYGDFFEHDFGAERFDLIVTAFVLRSFSEERLSEFFVKTRKLLASSGRLVILELTRPKSPVLQAVFFPYLKFWLPFAGALLTGSWAGYRFLKNSILNFKSSGELTLMLQKAGFSKIRATSLSGGIAGIFTASIDCC